MALSAVSCSPAVFESLKATAAVQFLASTSAMEERSRTIDARVVIIACVVKAAQARSSAVTVVRVVTSASFRLNERFRIRLMLVLLLFGAAHDAGQVQELGAD